MRILSPFILQRARKWIEKLHLWLKDFIPGPVNASKQERLYACIGAWFGLMVTGWLSGIATPSLFHSWFITSIGASAMLVFAVPSSPFAQPWSLIGGNVISALIGVTCAQWIDNSALAASLAGALAIAAMFSLRCMHPPSAAVALTAVLGGQNIRSLGYYFVLWPVGINSVFLLLTALVFNNALQRRYPFRHVDHTNPHKTKDQPPLERIGFSHPDFIQALTSHKELLDINEDDLEELFLQVEMHAHRRHFGELRCVDIMSKDIVSVEVGTTQDKAWNLLQKHKIELLPITDQGRLIGVVTQSDFAIMRGSPQQEKNAPTLEPTVDSIMQQEIKTASPEQAIVELVPLFINAELHHLPVINSDHHIIGMIAQSDILAAMFRARYENLSQVTHLPNKTS